MRTEYHETMSLRIDGATSEGFYFGAERVKLNLRYAVLEPSRMQPTNSLLECQARPLRISRIGENPDDWFGHELRSSDGRNLSVMPMCQLVTVAKTLWIITIMTTGTPRGWKPLGP